MTVEGFQAAAVTARVTVAVEMLKGQKFVRLNSSSAVVIKPKHIWPRIIELVLSGCLPNWHQLVEYRLKHDIKTSVTSMLRESSSFMRDRQAVSSV